MQEEQQNIQPEEQEQIIDNQDINIDELSQLEDVEDLKQTKESMPIVQLDFAMIKKTKDEKQENAQSEKKFQLEKYSNLRMRESFIKEKDFEAQLNKKEFIPISILDQKLLQEEQPDQLQYLTIGVLVELTGAMKAKSGKSYCSFKISDLNKYDTTKIEKSFANSFKIDETRKTLLKQFNSNGYKYLKVVAFGDVALEISKLKVGTIIGLNNAKLLSSTPETGSCLSIDNKKQYFKIGTSLDLGICKGAPKGTSQNGLPVIINSAQLGCDKFLNMEIENQCSYHQFMKVENKLGRIRSQRVGLHSDFIDLNKVKQQQLLMEKEKQMNKMNPNKSLSNIQKVQKAPLSPQSQAKIIEYKKKQLDQYDNYFKDREFKVEQMKNKKNFLANIECNETKHLSSACIPGVSNNLNQKRKAVIPCKPSADDDDDSEVEFDFGDSANKGAPSIKEMLMSSSSGKKHNYSEKFDDDQSQSNNKRQKIE